MPKESVFDKIETALESGEVPVAPNSPEEPAIPEGPPPPGTGYSPTEGREVTEGETTASPATELPVDEGVDLPPVEPPVEGAKPTQEEPEPPTAPEPETEPETPEDVFFNLPEDGQFVLKAGGQERVVTGKALADTFRHRQEQDRRYAELKARQQELEERSSKLPFEVRRDALELLTKRGFIDPTTGNYRIPEDLRGAREETVARAADEATKPLRINREGIAEDEDIFAPQHYEYFDRLGESIEAMNRRVQAMEERGTLRAQEQEEQRRLESIRAWNDTVKRGLKETGLFPTEDHLEIGLNSVLRHFEEHSYAGDISPGIEAAVNHARLFGATENAAPTSPAPTPTPSQAPTTLPPPEQRRMPPRRVSAPPAVGAGGPVSPERKSVRGRPKILDGTFEGKENLAKLIEEQLERLS